MRRGQVETQIFIYILAILVAALILLYGYRSISGFIDRGDRLALLNLERDLKEQVAIMSESFERVSIKTFAVPTKYTEICLLDLEKGGTAANNHDVCKDGSATFNPVVCTSWSDIDIEENVFIVGPKGATGRLGQGYLGRMSMDSPGCYPVINGQVIIKFTGIGGQARVDVQS